MTTRHCTLSITAILVTFALPATLAGQQNPFVPELPSGSLVVEYEHRGMTSGTSTLYLDGAKSAEVSETTVFGQRNTSRTVTTLDSIFEIATGNGSSHVTAIPNPTGEMARRFDALSSTDKTRFLGNMEAFGTDAGQMLSASFAGGQFEVTKGGTERIADETCEITDFGIVETCALSDAPNVVLRTRMNADMMCLEHEQTATRVQRGATIPADAFAVPADVERRPLPPEALAMMDGMGDRMFEAILEGRPPEEVAAEISGGALDDEQRQALEESRARMEEMQAQLAEIPPEQREQMCETMRAMMGGGEGGGLLGGLGDALRGEVAAFGSEVSDELRDEARREMDQAVEDAREDAKEEAKDEVRDRVRRGVRGIFQRP